MSDQNEMAGKVLLGAFDDMEARLAKVTAELAALKADTSKSLARRVSAEMQGEVERLREIIAGLREQHDNELCALYGERNGLREQHGRDSAELRSLCAARDEARAERDALSARNAEIEIACAQAVEFAEHFLSAPYAQELAGRLRERDEYKRDALMLLENTKDAQAERDALRKAAYDVLVAEYDKHEPFVGQVLRDAKREIEKRVALVKLEDGDA